MGKKHRNQTSGKTNWVTNQWEKTSESDQWEKNLGNRPVGKKTWVTDNDYNIHVYIRTIYKKNKISNNTKQRTLEN